MHNDRYSLVAIIAMTAVFAFTSVSVQAQEKTTTRPQEVTVTMAGQKFPLSFLAEDVPPETKAMIADDLQLTLGGLDEATFTEIADEHRSSYVNRYQAAVTHRLNLGEQKQWLPKVLTARFGVAVKVADTYHLIVHQRVIDAYKEALQLKQRRPVMFNRVDDCLAKLQTPKKRQEIARDLRKAREMFYFHKMEPWGRDEHYSRNLLPDPSATIRRPSLLDFTTLGALFRDSSVADIPAFLTLFRTRKDGKEYVAKWPPFVYVDGQWRILVFPLP
ncbi:MAG: hypothetical protein HQ559_12515 [Lentisphaerae bacterium]|nr:hypothetical protein [Lentisphaerota bacterium]